MSSTAAAIDLPALVALCSCALNLSGTRAGLYSAAIVVAWLAVSRRRWAVAGVAVAVVVGVLISLPMTSATVTERVGTASNGDRTVVWGYGLDAVGDQPILGFGPGNFRPATQARYSAEMAGTSPTAEPWFDAHNLVIEQAVTTGLAGLAALAAFAILARRRARGPLALAALGIVGTWMLQPAALSTSTMAMLALGASMTPVPFGEPSAARRWSTAGALLIGATAATFTLVADFRLADAVRRADLPALRAAVRYFPDDPVAFNTVVQAAARGALEGSVTPEQVLADLRRLIAMQPDRGRWWRTYAAGQMYFDQLPGARASLDQALALEPWGPGAWLLLDQLAKDLPDPELAATTKEKLCTLRLRDC